MLTLLAAHGVTEGSEVEVLARDAAGSLEVRGRDGAFALSDASAAWIWVDRPR